MEKVHKFTMLELLCVVSVIIVLVSLLMPALYRAKKAARGMQCSFYQKQIGMTFAEYSADFHDIYPIQHCRTDNRISGYGHNWAYQFSYKITYLPEYNRTVLPKETRCTENTIPATYFNSVYGWISVITGNFYYDKFGGEKNTIHYYSDAVYADGSSARAVYYNLRRMKNLSGLAFLACSFNAGRGTHLIAGGGAYYLWLAHNNRGGALFMDGHVEQKAQSSWISYMKNVNSWHRQDMMVNESGTVVPF